MFGNNYCVQVRPGKVIALVEGEMNKTNHGCYLVGYQEGEDSIKMIERVKTPTPL